MLSSFREPFLKQFTKLNCFVTLHFQSETKSPYVYGNMSHVRGEGE